MIIEKVRIALFGAEAGPEQGEPRRPAGRLIAWHDALEIVAGGARLDIPVRDIVNLYIREPFAGEPGGRSCVIDFTGGGEGRIVLEDAAFGDLFRKLEWALGTIWEDLAPWYRAKKTASPTRRWFNACSAIYHAATGADIELFGGEPASPERAALRREKMRELWGMRSASDVRAALGELLNGRGARACREEARCSAGRSANPDRTRSYALLPGQSLRKRRELLSEITCQCGDAGIWAWDLCRVMYMAAGGYVGGYLSLEEALDWNLRAGRLMQELFRSWDEMVQSYLYGYCYWADEDATLPGTEAHKRSLIYEELRVLPGNPYMTRWDQALAADGR